MRSDGHRDQVIAVRYYDISLNLSPDTDDVNATPSPTASAPWSSESGRCSNDVPVDLVVVPERVIRAQGRRG